MFDDELSFPAGVAVAQTRQPHRCTNCKTKGYFALRSDCGPACAMCGAPVSGTPKRKGLLR